MKLFIILIIVFLEAFLNAASCKIKGQPGSWYVEVDGKPFEIKGAGCANMSGPDNVNYIAMAQELGSTTIRTWGIDQGTKDYLDTAETFNLKVDAGIWLKHCTEQRKIKKFSYITDKEYLKKMENETLEYVNKYKNHPSIIMWNIGNEVIYYTTEEEERIAFCHFLESLIKKVKKTDPDHPVIYTTSSSTAFPYLKKYVPSLDIIGVNTYDTIESIHNEWKNLKFTIPYIITEAGPKGPWDREKDEFGGSIDEADYEKAFSYQLLLEEIDRYKGNCLGVFIFHLGDTTQESLTWWNINIGKYKRESFHTIREHFTRKICNNKPPLCIGLTLDQQIVKSGEKLTASIKARDRENDELSYDMQIATSMEGFLGHYVNEHLNVEIIQKGKEMIFTAPEKAGVYKLHVYVYDNHENVSTRSVSFKVI